MFVCKVLGAKKQRHIKARLPRLYNKKSERDKESKNKKEKERKRERRD